MESLAQIYSRHSADRHAGMGDKGTLHSYIPVYEELLSPYRQTTGTVLEIGVADGHSLRMWREYFPVAKVVGVDIQDTHSRIDGCTFVLGDATKQEIYRGMGMLDVVIDDGSHLPRHQIASFQLLWPRLRSGGMYFIEDVQRYTENRPFFSALTGTQQVWDFRPVSGVCDDVLIAIAKET